LSSTKRVNQTLVGFIVAIHQTIIETNVCTLVVEKMVKQNTDLGYEIRNSNSNW